jgi:GntR family transcriptional regulator/MocR family aminotransferase
LRSRTSRSGSRGIYETIKGQIGTGIYPPGSALSSSRTLAAELGVARSTVTIAYEQLVAEGYLEVIQGSRPKVPISLRLPTHQPQSPAQTSSNDHALSDYGKRLFDWQPWKPRPDLLVDFRYGSIAGSDFPRKAWKHAFNAAMRTAERQEAFAYVDSRGLLTLRKALQGYLWRARGIRCDAEQIIVVNGSQQGLDICGRLFIDAGDRVVVEEPAYSLARVIFRTYGASIATIAVDADGMQTDDLQTIDGARLGYVTPSHQFPLGGVLPTARRQQLLDWSNRNGAYLIEDDYDGEFRYDIKPIEPLYSLDSSSRVIYLGTLSKTLSPQLRLGYLVVPSHLVEAFARAKKLSDWHSPILEQGALAELIGTGAYERHVRQIRRRNGQRREQLLAQLARHLGDQVTVVGSSAGLHVVVWFNQIPWTREQDLIDRAEHNGVGLYGVSPLYDTDERRLTKPVAGAVFGYAALSSAQIEEGCIRLRKTLNNFQEKLPPGRVPAERFSSAIS